MRIASTALFVALLSWIPAQAFGQEEDATARSHFEAGRSHYDRGAYEEAQREFEAAYELSQRPALLYNLYLVAERLGDLDTRRAPKQNRAALPQAEVEGPAAHLARRRRPQTGLAAVAPVVGAEHLGRKGLHLGGIAPRGPSTVILRGSDRIVVCRRDGIEERLPPGTRGSQHNRATSREDGVSLCRPRRFASLRP